jgi:hypothetical protein
MASENDNVRLGYQAFAHVPVMRTNPSERRLDDRAIFLFVRAISILRGHDQFLELEVVAVEQLVAVFFVVICTSLAVPQVTPTQLLQSVVFVGPEKKQKKLTHANGP